MEASSSVTDAAAPQPEIATGAGPTPESPTGDRSLTFLLRPKWIGFHLLVIGAVLLMINLGFWQLRRLDERRTDNAQFTTQIEIAPVLLDDMIDDLAARPETLINRRVIATGSYSPDQIVLFNRSQGGRAVDNVLTPLLLDGGEGALIVNRGAIPVEAVPPTPLPGEVEIVGRLRPSESRERGALTDAEQDRVSEVRRVDLEMLASAAPDLDVLPMYVELIESDPAPGLDDPFPLDPPTLSEGNHLSYAFQWFIFSGAVVVGWVLAVRRSIRARRAPRPAIDETRISADE